MYVLGNVLSVYLLIIQLYTCHLYNFAVIGEVLVDLFLEQGHIETSSLASFLSLSLDLVLNSV